MKNIITLTLAVVLTAGTMQQCLSELERQTAQYEAQAQRDTTEQPRSQEQQLLLPTMPQGVQGQLLLRTGYMTSYCEQTRCPHWVAWALQDDPDVHHYSRQGIPYAVDEEVQGIRQEPGDWRGHGLPIDHGHMCPAADCNYDRQALEETFLLTNMCPQNSELNRGDWEYLESRCRGWSRHFGKLYIVAGPLYYADRPRQTIGQNHVAVPHAFYKVILRLTPQPQALAFVYPNEGDHHRLSYYLRTVDQVEELTGFDFFTTLPDHVEQSVEAHSALRQWDMPE